MTGASVRPGGVRYEPDERPPVALAAGLGLQLAVLCIAGIALTPAIVVRAAGAAESYLTWAVFAAVLVSGISTVLQAVRVGRVGAGYVLAMGTSGAFIAICVAAIAQGGPAMLATLVVISSLFQFLLAWRLSLLRRILTPTVSGTVIMLIPVTVMPIVFDMLSQVPEGTPEFGAPLAAPCDHPRHVRHLPEGAGSSPPLGAGRRYRRRLRGRRVLRLLRSRGHRRGIVGGGAGRRMAGLRYRLRPDLLGAPAGVRIRDPGRRHRDGGRRHRHPAGLLAQAAGGWTFARCRAR